MSLWSMNDGTDTGKTVTVADGATTATFNADVSGGNLRLLAAGESSNSTVYKIHFIATKV